MILQKIISKTRRYDPRRLFRPGNKLTILAYHSVFRPPININDWCYLNVHEFENQMEYLKDHFDIVSLEQGLELSRKGELKGQKIVITFDDGFYNNFSIAFPVLEKYQIPATIYLATAFIDSPDTIWFAKVIHAIGKTDRNSLEWRGKKYDLSNPQKKELSSAKLQGSMKSLPHHELLEELQVIGDLLGVPWDGTEEYSVLDTPQIRAMQESGLVQFGAHTHKHAILSRISGKSQKEEIEKSLKKVEEVTGKKCRHFAYPNGGAKNYDGNTLEILKNSSVQSAVTMINGSNYKGNCSLQLKRLGIGGKIKLSQFKKLIDRY